MLKRMNPLSNNPVEKTFENIVAKGSDVIFEAYLICLLPLISYEIEKD